jgi:hypothetical protein
MQWRKKRKHCWNNLAFQFAQDSGFPFEPSIVGKQHTRWSCFKTPICGACGTWVQIVHANFEAQQSEHQNKKQMNCVVL